MLLCIKLVFSYYNPFLETPYRLSPEASANQQRYQKQSRLHPRDWTSRRTPKRRPSWTGMWSDARAPFRVTVQLREEINRENQG